MTVPLFYFTLIVFNPKGSQRFVHDNIDYISFLNNKCGYADFLLLRPHKMQLPSTGRKKINIIFMTTLIYFTSYVIHAIANIIHTIKCLKPKKGNPSRHLFLKNKM